MTNGLILVSKSQVHIEPGLVVGDASDMGFPVGGWPEMVAVLDDGPGPVRTGWLFFRGREILTDGGECGGYRYADRTGEMLMTVFND